ncbi:hypothetical protein K2173_028545 [Erythroxylum novogranatense]|uniref:Chaperone DnaJ C-terminal domain-containing protein n=1 Tax=Erythroxylum novogranatense TaxID=1862640 RepID=A0AAV8U2F1_9ROSI|nr:hypothetical protein K2173_028545 [Erythroxylum novogranatense]
MSRIHCCMYSARSKRHNKDKSPSPKASLKHKSLDNALSHIPSLSRNGSPRSSSPTPALVQKSMSRKSSELSTNGFPASLSRSVSRRSTTPIMFSNSSGMLKPPPIQKDLDCTLEELCYGCTKKVKVTRDVLTNTGQIAEEEEVLKIKVKPGWTKGTTISFEGMGNETLGCFPADINFVIAEKRHSLFRRDGDDLEIVVEIPLVKALTGCEISVPLLGGEEMSLRIDDVIYPGYQEVIEGQGMPSTKEQGKRGDLKVVFLVEFPAQLTDEQRSDIFSILAEDSC